jgi:uncharacterized repeat protein (TIGR01451 family)
MRDILQIANCKLQIADWPSTPRPALWRWAIIGLGMLVLCSCKSAETRPPVLQPPPIAACPMPPPAGPPGMEFGVPTPYTPGGPWRPPGIAGPWPPDEYVCDGGTAGPTPRVSRQKDVRGLEMEDTIAHFDTPDGKTLVEPSNRVCLYTPRFGSVRQVVYAEIDQQRDRAAGVALPVAPAAPKTRDLIVTNTQKLQAVNELGSHPAQLLRRRQSGDTVSSRIGPRGFDNNFKAFENTAVIRQGLMTEAEGPFLAKGVAAAVAWIHKQAVQVLIDNQQALAEVGTQKPESVFTLNTPAHPRLRVIKVASTPFAEPGDEVDFTIRFDNLGDQPLSHVTILDSLSTRLEYIPDSAQCSLNARFSVRPNEGDSSVVRCELSDTLMPGKGGVFRFHCRVR